MAIFICAICFILMCIILSGISAVNDFETTNKIFGWYAMLLILVFTMFFSVYWDETNSRARHNGVEKEVIHTIAEETGYSYFEVADYLAISVQNGMKLEKAIHNIAPGYSDAEIDKILNK